MSNSHDYPFHFVVEDDILIKYEGYDSAVDIPDGIIAIENKAFWYNKFVTKITLPDTVMAIGNYAFCGCKALNEINIPDGVRHIGKMAFNGCTKLSEIEIPDSVEEIGAQAFGNCSSLDTVTLSAVKKLPQCVFANCKSLEYLQIAEGTEKIGDAALYECDSLETVVIPGTVESIGESVIEGCDSLEEIHYLGTEKEFNKIDKADDFEAAIKDINLEFTEEPAPTPAKKPEPQPAPAKKEESKPEKATEFKMQGKLGDTPVVAPLPGVIYDIKVTLGQRVKKGDVLCELEAMKMLNDIPAPKDGVIASINVQKGSSVTSNDVLVSLNDIKVTDTPAKKAPIYESNSKNNPNGIAIGDTVVISNSGQRYPSYESWFDTYAPDLKPRFAKDKELVSGNYTVLTMGMHTPTSDTLCCAIESVSTKQVWLIGATGIKKASSVPAVTSNSTNNPLGLKVGDTVQVSDAGKQYSSYDTWLANNAPSLKSKFVNNKKVDTSATYKIAALANHSAGNTTLLAAIEAGSSVFVMGVLGLKKSQGTVSTESYTLPTDMKAGDTVIVTDDMQRYTTYNSWFDTYAPEYKSSYAYGSDIIPSGTFTLVKIAPHTTDKTVFVCCLKHSNGKYYLIQKKGVAKAPATPTVVSNSTNNPNGIAVGDTVIVSDSGKRYSSYSMWFTTNAPHLASRFAKDKPLPSGTFKVLAMAYHSTGNTTICCAIENTADKTVHLIGALGLKKSTASTSYTSSFSSTSSSDFREGDTVIVTDVMQRYPTYNGWFDVYAPEYKWNYAYDQPIPSGTFTLMKMAPHTGDKSVYVCCLKHNGTGKYYLVQKKGVAKAAGGSASTYKSPSYTSNSTNNPNGIAIGDTVVVTNSGQRYPSYEAWFTDNAPHLKSRFAKDKELVSGNYTVLTMGMHSTGSTTLCCAIESVSTKQVWLIGATGIKKAGYTSTISSTSSFGGKSFGNLSNNPNGLKIGDTVVVTNSGKQYTTYSSWFDKNAPQLKGAFAYSSSISTYGRYTIVAAAPHSVGSDTMVCAVKSNSDGKVYLIGALGIKRA